VVLKGVGQRMGRDRITLMASGLAYSAILSLVPALAALVSLYGLVRSPEGILSDVGSLTAPLPGDVRDLVNEQVTTLAGSGSGLGIGLVVSVVLSAWTVSGGVNQLINGVNAAYEVEESRPVAKVRALALGFALCLVLLAATALLTLTVLPAVVRAFGLGELGTTLVSILRFPLLAAVVALVVGVVYKLGPDRSAKEALVSPGSLAATALWVVASIAFSAYVSNFGSYNATYGSLGAVVVLLIWLQLSALAILLGAVLNSVVDAWRRDELELEDKPGVLEPLKKVLAKLKR
jgi:membrane protein